MVDDPRSEVTHYIRTKEFRPDTLLALRELVNDLNNEVTRYKELQAVPSGQQTNVRNDMYVASEAIRLMQKNGDVEVHPTGEWRTQRLSRNNRQVDQVHSPMG